MLFLNHVWHVCYLDWTRVENDSSNLSSDPARIRDGTLRTLG